VSLKEAAARDELPESLREHYDAMVADYRFVCEKRYSRAWVNYEILAEMVLRGWRSPRPGADEASQNPKCDGCGGPHSFDTTVPSPIWNEVVRARGGPEYLCLTCIALAFVRAGKGFTAELWGLEFNGRRIAFSLPTAAPETGGKK